MELEEYEQKRNFDTTPEPEGRVGPSLAGNLYVIQKHAASRLHYDLRLELDGVLKSWAVPKGPSLRAGEKRLAVHVEDHPVEYGAFEGVIPEGEYGGGTVMLWDRGTWAPIGDPREGFLKGDLKFELHGQKLRGSWVLARMKGKAGEEDKNWLLIKKRDGAAISGTEPEPVETRNRSVSTGRTMEEIREEGNLVRPSPVVPANLPGARKAPQPVSFRPQLAVSRSDPPEGDDWVHEIKYDGYRILSLLAGGRVRLLSRNGREWTDRFREIATALSALPVESCILDGEVVVVDEKGRTDFQALQNLLQGIAAGSLAYFVFDLPWCAGYDLTRTPLLERKTLLKQLLEPLGHNSRVLFAEHIRGQGGSVFNSACRLGLEGIVSKQANSPYEQKRSRRWGKVKCFRRQEFVVGGFTDPGGAREGFGALLLGCHDPGGNLLYAGRVGTGFDDRMLRKLSAMLFPMQVSRSPFVNPPTGYEARGVHYIRPELVVEVEFSDWTSDGILRHPSFKGIREDKDPAEIVREESLSAKTPSLPPARPAAASSGPYLTNPDRVFYPEIGITKQDLADYYADIADRILPHLRGRPLSLVRCPEGRGKECFFQKHLGDSAPRDLKSLQIKEKDGREYYSVLDDAAGLTALAQIGVLEIHVWGSREQALEQPDMMIFDLDPAPDVAWERMIEAALTVRDRLAETGLASFVKTTGGKGLHIVVPLLPAADWTTVKAFSKALADRIVRDAPEKYIATMSREKRKGKIFIDYLRNGRGATSIAPYSTRKRQNAPVAVPVSWEELISGGLRSDSFTLHNIRRRLESLAEDPWEGYFPVRQEITDEMKIRSF